MTSIDQTRTVTDYEATVRIKASPDAVFDAITTPDGLAAWWNPATGSGLTGGELRFKMDPPEPLVIRVDEAVRPASVRWTVTDCLFMPDWVGTRPTFTIRPVYEGVTEVRFCHLGLTDELDCREMCSRSWDHYVMTSLRDYLESGSGHPIGSLGDKARRAAEGRA